MNHDLRKYIPLVRSQYSLGSCSAQACCLAAEMLLFKAQKQTYLSAMFLYYMARKNQGRIGKYGVPLQYVLRAMEQYGVPIEEYWPYKTSNENIEPTSDAIFHAALSRLQKFEIIPHTSNDVYIQKIKAWIAKDIPVIVGISTGTKFWNLSGPLEHQRYEPVNATDNLPSTSHAVVIVGYSDDLNGGSFIIANSLGPKWGDSGFGAFPYRCAIDIGEAWVIKNFAGVGI